MLVIVRHTLDSVCHCMVYSGIHSRIHSIIRSKESIRDSSSGLTLSRSVPRRSYVSSMYPRCILKTPKALTAFCSLFVLEPLKTSVLLENQFESQADLHYMHRSPFTLKQGLKATVSDESQKPVLSRLAISLSISRENR